MPLQSTERGQPDPIKAALVRLVSCKRSADNTCRPLGCELVGELMAMLKEQ